MEGMDGGGYVAPLPPGWMTGLDPQGRVIFYNPATQESSWTHPVTGEVAIHSQ